MKQHVQCLLRKASVAQVAWIPSALAVKGKLLKLKTDDGDWDDGWVVANAARRIPQPSDLVQKRAMDFKKMRRRTDI